jgi:hypothetical protein
VLQYHESRLGCVGRVTTCGAAFDSPEQSAFVDTRDTGKS